MAKPKVVLRQYPYKSLRRTRSFLIESSLPHKCRTLLFFSPQIKASIVLWKNDGGNPSGSSRDLQGVALFTMASVSVGYGGYNEAEALPDSYFLWRLVAKSPCKVKRHSPGHTTHSILMVLQAQVWHMKSLKLGFL